MALQGFQVSIMILLAYCCYYAVQGCTVTVKEANAQIEHQILENISLPCQVTYSNCQSPLETYWFRCLTSHCEKICDKSCINERFRSMRKKGLKVTGTMDTYLKITNLHISDSAIYICGAGDSKSPDIKSKATGQGTTLIVKGEAQSIVTTGCVVLIIFCVLFFLYSIAVFSIYAFRSKLKIFKEPKTEEAGNNNKSYRRQRIFQAIAQEYHKRYPRKSMSPNSTRGDDAIYQNTQSP
ncbi:immunoglobulin superfamily member 6-like [Xenopus laevis]|uniref:Ig-like domain-containing protein n=1 Tax=Xenopus laevis TaxID=8355 RepID=A0A974BVJ7_XENLA|nr:immunoglobulin superfamily member 6-like [Xenopus laevis]OCT61597.1 hypothetical protein XELAEV_18047626mg [Xenopus laevis]